jgi:hypothetical protein
MHHTFILLAGTLFLSACATTELELETTEHSLSSASLVLTDKGCASYASLGPTTRGHLDTAERLTLMSPEERRAAGVSGNPTLSRGELASYEAIQSDPCHVSADVSCVSGGENGTSWVMCTDGITTCGASIGNKVTVWCR